MITPPLGPVPDDAGTQGLLASLVVNAPVGIFFKDLDGVYVFVNDAYIVACGHVTNEEVLGRTDGDLYPEDIATLHRRDDRSAVERGGPVQNLRPFPVNGVERTFNTVKFPLRTASGDAVGVCGITIDITDTLQERKDQEIERLRAIAAKPFERLFATLTNQEAKVAELLSVGSSNKEIAEALNLAPDTVRHHVSRVLKKLRKQSRTQAVIEILRNRRRP